VKRKIAGLASVGTVVASLGLAATAVSGAASADPAATDMPSAQGEPQVKADNRPDHLSVRQTSQRRAAVDALVAGDATLVGKGPDRTIQLSNGVQVDYPATQSAKLLTFLVEFGDADYGHAYTGNTAGPLHNTIPEPGADDNTTYWRPNFDRQHFMDMFFNGLPDQNGESFRSVYKEMSSGRFDLQGDVSDWVKVPNAASYYQAADGSGDEDGTSMKAFLTDGATAWYNAQKTAGKSDQQIKDYLAQFDVWDRFDFDGDGNYNEPDGYIDHFQIVHAGEDESAGGGAQGTDAIWAHRWYAYGTDAGNTGPADNKLGGTQIGDTGIWVGDYTVQPENGGLGVFAHEYGHDLGLPDHYDTTNTAENSTGFWTLMSSGSWLGTGKNTIGDTPGDFSAWDKLQLGWLDYATAKAATKSVTKLGVAEYNTKDKQALVVDLPEKTVTTDLVTPASGSYQWWSGSGNSLSNTLTRDVDLTGKTSASLSLKGFYDIETAYDYLYTEVSTDGGTSWTPVDGTVGGAAIPRDASDQPALTGTVDSYQDLVYPLDAYAGQSVKLRFRYATDSGVAQKGFAADDITVTADGSALVTDGAENGDNGWTADGFTVKGASFSDEYAQYYIAENRQYVSYDQTLKVGPYNFGFLDTKENWVEHFPYQNGLLIWLWDTSQGDNNVSAHPGQGLVLPIDAHAKPLKWSDGTVMRNRIQAYDSTFTLEPTDALTLHKLSAATKIKSQKGAPVFDDRKGTYYYAANPYGGVQVPDTNTKIRILWQTKGGSTVTVAVGPSTK
jgi:immune inhibitor A